MLTLITCSREKTRARARTAPSPERKVTKCAKEREREREREKEREREREREGKIHKKRVGVTERDRCRQRVRHKKGKRPSTNNFSTEKNGRSTSDPLGSAQRRKPARDISVHRTWGWWRERRRRGWWRRWGRCWRRWRTCSAVGRLREPKRGASSMPSRKGKDCERTRPAKGAPQNKKTMGRVKDHGERERKRE